MSSIRFYQTGDYQSTILRKFLENDSQTISGSQSLSVAAGTGSRAPNFPAPNDTKYTLLRKFLENQAQSIAGNMTVHLR